MKGDDMTAAAKINSIEVRDGEPVAPPIVNEVQSLFDEKAAKEGADGERPVLPLWQYRKLQAIGIDMTDYDYNPYEFRAPKEGGVVAFGNREARRRAQRERRRA